MKKLIEEIYNQNFNDSTKRSLLMILADARPKDHDTIFSKIKPEEMATIKKKMKIVSTIKPASIIESGCDGCPDTLSDEVAPKMEKLKIASKDVLIEVEGNVKTVSKPAKDITGEILNRFESNKLKMVEYCREKGYEVKLNYSVLTIAKIIQDNEA